MVTGCVIPVNHNSQALPAGHRPYTGHFSSSQEEFSVVSQPRSMLARRHHRQFGNKGHGTKGKTAR